jgi:hypothetical protein
MPTFIPPIVEDVPAVLPETTGLAYRLFRHYGPYRRGRSVLKHDGVYQTYDTPSDVLVNSAEEVYLGGHVYEVTPAVADALVLAGYQVWAELVWDDYLDMDWEDIEGIPWEVL